ncbi:antitoxin [Nocardia pseudovaccinii]|uniref:antitoxin n=1 Tax=Nocardia pseudovaccinii TaxID=189540 RepID=UPI003D8A432F
MELAVSLSGEDVAVLDAEVGRSGLPGRSAAVHKAIALLRCHALEDAYEEAWDEWNAVGEEAVWSATAVDSLT